MDKKRGIYHYFTQLQASVYQSTWKSGARSNNNISINISGNKIKYFNELKFPPTSPTNCGNRINIERLDPNLLNWTNRNNQTKSLARKCTHYLATKVILFIPQYKVLLMEIKASNYFLACIICLNHMWLNNNKNIFLLEIAF